MEIKAYSRRYAYFKAVTSNEKDLIFLLKSEIKETVFYRRRPYFYRIIISFTMSRTARSLLTARP
ncbi:MAG: hypothetical protein MR518_06090, partial [Mollicutes bacterium]|nr:hypothetical protein [Mollicutes bacterium]